MDDTFCQVFFQQPDCPAHRQYEALRAIFLDGLSQKDAALRFGYDYDAFRQLVHQFRQACVSGNPPPFSSHSAADDLPSLSGPSPFNPTRQIVPTPVS
jgi:hypothetical protein